MPDTLCAKKLEFQTLTTVCQTLFVPEIAADTLFFYRPSACWGHGARSELIKFLATSVGALLCEHPEMLQRFVVGAVQKAQPPQPSDHVLAQLKAGETVYQAGELPETLRVSKIDYEPPKTVCKTTFASIFPPSMENGDGTRHSAMPAPS